MRKCVAVAFAALVVVVTATPAWAHEEINPKSFPTGQPTFFLLSAANEEKADLAKITLTAPAGVPIGATTREPAGWTVTKTTTAITWSAGADAAIKPDHFDQWGFETDGADQPGTFTFNATLGFTDGKTNDVQIPVTVVANNSASVTTTTPAASGLASPPAPANQAKSRANTALVLGSIAMVLGLAALAAAFRRGRPRPATGADQKVGTDSQDW